MSEASEATAGGAGTGAAQQLTDLRDKVAIVTGASSGIGEAIAEALSQHGAHVALAARRTERLEALASRLQQVAPESQTLVVPCDVRVPQDAERLVQSTLDRWGRLDILIANAGFGYRSPIVEGDVARWKDLLDTNVYGLLLTLKYGVRPMLAQRSGHVIVTSSVAARVVTPGGGAYCGSKAAATAIAEALRMEVARDGVRVTTIEPGVVISEFQRVAEYAPGILENMLKGAQPLVPADIARTVIFALRQPTHVGVHELVIRPAGQTYP
jgi:NADP-dependent 3-hydroxy acid dehydrogenase YdfG